MVDEKIEKNLHTMKNPGFWHPVEWYREMGLGIPKNQDILHKLVYLEIPFSAFNVRKLRYCRLSYYHSLLVSFHHKK